MIVFVHGVPETAAIWDDIRQRIDRPSIALSMPGFGNPRPEGFGATKDEYLDWLLGELDRLDDPIDLVGHDWGAILTARIASAYGDRVRSYVFDVGNVSHPDYEWHAFAQIWQTPGEEAEAAAVVAAAGDEVMGGCILDLYRSATPNPHHAWGPLAPSPAAGLVVHPTDDPFSDEPKAREVAVSLGAAFATLDGAGHFWPVEAPDQGAGSLQDFWATVT